MRLPALLALAAVLAPAAPAAIPAPRVRSATFEQLPKPLPLPYAETGDASASVKRARAQAKAAGKLLLIDLGGNWCLDCRLLAGVMELPEVRRWLPRHYVLVTVNVGRFDTNLAVPARYGIRKRLEGVPSLLVVDPRTDRLLNEGRTAALADARSMTPQGLADYLAQWPRR
ncbi:thioredoxin family protein [Sphingomonas sp.]|uniref:thioredoxin family protein n=1 Tax=Sphingomonas sp. TaxID=28214 RepID=UPI003B3B3AEC